MSELSYHIVIMSLEAKWAWMLLCIWRQNRPKRLFCLCRQNSHSIVISTHFWYRG